MSNLRTWSIHNRVQAVYEYKPGLCVFSFDLFSNRGQYIEKQSQKGITHLISSLYDRGCRKYSEMQLQRMIFDDQIDFDGIMGNHYLGLEFQTPKKNWKKAISLSKEVFFEPSFDPKHVKQESSVIIQEIQKLENYPEEVLTKEFFAHFFHNHPYANHAWGNIDYLATVNASEMHQWYKKNILGGNFYINLVGSIEPSQVKSFLAKVFSDLDFLEEAQEEIKIIHTYKPDKIRKDTQFKKLYGALGFPLCDVRHQDRHALEWIRNYLVSGIGGVLFQSIREEHGLVYGIDCNNSFLPYAGCMLISYSADIESEEKIDELIQKELELLINDLIDPDKFSRMQKYIEGSSIIEWDVASHHVGYYNQAVLYNTPLDPEKELEAILSLTPKDIQKVAQKYLSATPLEIKLIPTK